MSNSITTYTNRLSIHHSNLVLPTIMVLISCVGFGLVPFFAKSLTEAGVASSLVPFYRYAISSIVFLCIPSEDMRQS